MDRARESFDLLTVRIPALAVFVLLSGCLLQGGADGFNAPYGSGRGEDQAVAAALSEKYPAAVELFRFACDGCGGVGLWKRNAEKILP